MLAVLFELSPVNAATGVRQTLRFASANDDRLTGLNGVEWWPGIARSPTLNRDGWNGNFDGSIALAQALVEIHLHALRAQVPTASALRWAGAPFVVYRGEVGDVWADFEMIFSGLVTQYESDSLRLSMTAQVDSEPFEADLLANKYSGTGEYQGVEDLKDKVRPAVFGRCQNVEPVMIQTVDNIFEVHGYGPIEDIPMVYERAAAFGPSLGDYPDYNSLLHAAVPEGRWATCLTKGLFRLGAPPFGVITADVDGDNTGGWHRTTAAIMQRLCDIAAVDPSRIDAASMAAFEAACAFPINLYMTSAEKLIDVLQKLARPCNAQAGLSWLGKLQVTTFDAIGAPTMRLEAQGRSNPPVLANSEMDVQAPWWRIEMHANRSWRVHSKDEISFIDPSLGVNIPVSVYRRWPYLPPNPEGDGIPDGWSTDPPDFSSPADVPSSIFKAFGPIWESHATQTYGETLEGGWSLPVLTDSKYKGFVLNTSNVSDRALAGTDKCKATDGWNAEEEDFPDFFSYEGITGPFKLSARVRSKHDRVGFGVVPYSPFQNFSLGQRRLGDIKDGFWIAQNDVFEVKEYHGGPFIPTTGVFVYQDFDAGLNFIDEETTTVLEVPIDDCLFEMVWNGDTVEHWVDGVRVRTHYINDAWDGATHWPVFVCASPGAEIYDIKWERATQGSELEFPYDYVFGTLRRMDNEDGWEIYGPRLGDGFGAGWIYSRSIKVGGYAETSIAAGTGPGSFASAIFEFSDIGGFAFNLDGTNTYEAYLGSSTTVLTGTWADGDNFAVKWSRKRVRWYKNGAFLKKKKKNPSGSTNLYLEFAGVQASGFYDIKLVPVDEEEFAVKGTASDPSYLTPITDASPTISGGYVVIGETPDIAFSIVEDADDFNLTASLTYTKTAGAAANFTPVTTIQYSVDGGVTWAGTVSTTQVPGSAPASTTGTPQLISLTGSVIISPGTGTIRFRIATRNLTAGTFTATLTGNIYAEWTG